MLCNLLKEKTVVVWNLSTSKEFSKLMLERIILLELLDGSCPQHDMGG